MGTFFILVLAVGFGIGESFLTVFFTSNLLASH